MAEFTNIKINDVKYDVRDANAARASALATKQDVISDLATIRSGAAAGATALQSYTETDPTVPAWAKASTKPSYTASEVGAMPTTHPANAITSAKISEWNGKMQRVVINMEENNGTLTFTDVDNNVLTHAQVRAIFNTTSNYVSLSYDDYLYTYDDNNSHEDYWQFRVLNLDKERYVAIWWDENSISVDEINVDSLDVNYVPSTRRINNKPLRSDITLNASEVGAVPTTRTVNGKALSSNITLSASDVGALPSNTHIPADQVQSNWNETNTSSKAYIQNKPTIPDTSTLATKTELNAKQDKINDLAAIRSGAAKGATSVQTISVNGGTPTQPTNGNVNITIPGGGGGGYEPPAGGIPKTDLASGVQTSLGKADSAIQGVKVNGTELTPDADKKVSFSAVAGLQFDGSSHVGVVQLPEYVKTSDYNTKIDDIYQSIPSDLADLADDKNHRVVTDADISRWNYKQNAIGDLATIRSGAAAGATAYQKPSGGIPASDIASGVIPDTSGFVTTSSMNTALAGKANASDVYTKAQTDTLLSGKQNTLTFDSTPTASSTNPVTSGGVKTYVDGKASITGITTSQDGTFTITLSDGNSYTVNLNHVHPQYVESDDLAEVATSGSYNDLSDKPTIPAAQVNADWNATSGVSRILNKPSLANYYTKSEIDTKIGNIETLLASI